MMVVVLVGTMMGDRRGLSGLVAAAEGRGPLTVLSGRQSRDHRNSPAGQAPDGETEAQGRPKVGEEGARIALVGHGLVGIAQALHLRLHRPSLVVVVGEAVGERLSVRRLKLVPFPEEAAEEEQHVEQGLGLRGEVVEQRALQERHRQ